MKRQILATSVILVFLFCAGSGFTLEPGDKAAPFVNLDMSKKHVLSKTYLGQGWLILDFFATDCEGCKKELPIIEQLYQDYSDRGLEVIVFATDPEGVKVVGPFFEKRSTPLMILLDHYQVTVKKYGVGEIPSLFLIDPEGIIVHREVGYREDLYQLISSFLKP